MYRFFYICFSVSFFIFSTSETNLLEELSNVKWYCADENCSEPISLGHGLRPNNPVHPLSWLEVNFNVNDRISIFGKPNNGTEPLNNNWWLVQVGNRKGVAPVRYIQEDKVIVNKLNQVEAIFDFSSLKLPPQTETHASKEAIKPSPTRIVIDGTYIPQDGEEELVEEISADEGSGEILNEPPKLEVSENQDSLGTKINKVTPLKSSVENSLLVTENNTLADIDNRTIHLNIDNRTIQQNVDIENLGNAYGLNVNNDFDTTESKLTEASKLQTVASGNPEVPGNQSNVTEQSPIATEKDNLAKIPVATVLRSSNSPAVSLTEALTTSPVSVANDDDGFVKGAEMTSSLPVNDTINMQDEAALNISDVHGSTHGLNVNNQYVTTESQSTEASKLPPEASGNLEAPSNQYNVTEHGPVVTEHGPVVTKSDKEAEINVSTDINKESVSVDTSHSEIDSAALQNVGPVPNMVSSGLESLHPISTTEHSSQQMDYSHQDGISENDAYSQNNAGITEDNVDLVPPPASHAEPMDGKPSDSVLLKDVINTAESTVDSSSPELSGSKHEVHTPESTATLPEENVREVSSTSGKVEGNNEEESQTTPHPVGDYDLFDSTPEEAGFGGWFSGFSSVMSSFKEMFTKSNIGDDKDFSTDPPEESVSVPEKSTVIKETIDGEMRCDKEPLCSQFKEYSQSTDEEEKEEKGNALISGMFEGFSGSKMSLSTIVCLVITAVVVLLFSLGHYYLENLKQDSVLIVKINTLSSELFFAQKELASIEEQYQQANENYQKLITETSHNEVSIEEMRKELEGSKAARRALEDEIIRLEKEIESLVEEGDEMHRMLAESFSEEERTKSLLANISDLKGVLSERLQEIVSLTEQLDKEKQEVELLTIRLKKSEEKQEATEDKLAKVLNDADSKTLAVTKEYEEKISTLERIIEERSLERTNFEKEICELKGSCESLVVEKELAEKELRKAHGVGSGKALNEWLETKQLRADFLAIQKKVDELKKVLEEAKQRGAFLEGREKELLNEIESLNNKYEAAEKDKIEALTKLQVLSNYFKEKEIKLQEELGTKEAQWLQKQSEGHTIYEQMRSLREENLSYKAQNEALKKEILDQETSFKIQIANEEQKAQENWINLRHTERRLKEVQMEAAHLRSRLTALEANPDSLEEKHKSLEMVNGDVTMGAASPPFMLYPPPDFIPPPPLVSPTRPPPLGRLSSPPLTPPAPLSPFEFFPPPPPSPPPPLRAPKHQLRDSHRKQKDSQSSNHSSESIEKPVRRGKR